MENDKLKQFKFKIRQLAKLLDITPDELRKAIADILYNEIPDKEMKSNEW